MRRIRAHMPVAVLLLAAGWAVLFLGGLGRLPLFGRDESLYAEAAREMLATGDWISPRVNGEFFFEKPPLHYWLAAACYGAFGVSTFAARLPAALMAVLTIALTAGIGAKIWSRRVGILAGIALATSLQIAIIGRMGIMDVPLMFLTALALLVYARWRAARGAWLFPLGAAFGLCIGLAVLLKGMAGFLPVPIAGVHWLIWRRHPGRPVEVRGTPAGRACAVLTSLFAGLAAFVIVAVPWFYVMVQRHGDPFVSTLLGREHLARIAEPMQGHGGIALYYVVVIAVSFFPWVMFLPTALFSRGTPVDEHQAFWRSLLIVWFAVVLIPFSLIRTKLPGYVAPLFPAMALLVGIELDRRLRAPGRGPWIAVLAGAVVLAGLVALLPAYGARLGESVEAAHAASRLIPPVAVWIAGCGIIVLGAAAAIARRTMTGVALTATGQMVVLAAVLLGILPVLSPYLEGGREYRLAEIAQRELPHSQIILYDTRPEAVAFVLGRTIPCHGDDEWHEVARALGEGPTGLIASTDERDRWEALPIGRQWQLGNRVLLEIDAKVEHQRR